MTEEQWEGLLNHLSEGGSVVKFARGMGDEEGIRAKLGRRLRSDDEFATKYARAKMQGIEFRLEQVRTRIEESDPAEVGKTRLIWDHERWEASKLLPRKYGDKLDLTSKGEQIGKVYLVKDGEEDWTEKV